MSGSALERARAGSEEAFRELTEPYRYELHLHCYRMLGSLSDAEDVLQETLLAAWRGLAGFEGRSSVRTWLYRIATNRCLNVLRDAKRRVPAEPVPPFDPPPPTRRSDLTRLQPYPDVLLEQGAERSPSPEVRYVARETVELAFVTAVQALPPRQAASLLLCDVLGFTLAEVAPMLDASPAAVKGALQRARAAMARLHDTPPGPHRPHRPTEPAHEHDLARRFAKAFTEDDIDGVIALLTDDAWLAMPPAPHEYHGATAIHAFLSTSATHRAGRRFQLTPTGANTQPAFTCHLAPHPGSTPQPTGLLVLTMQADRINTITHFQNPALPAAFGPADAS